MPDTRLHLAATALAGVAAASGLATAASVEWTSPDDGLFHVGANWSTGTPPTDLDTALIDVTGSVVTVFHALGASRVDVLNCREAFEVTGTSSIGFDTFGSFTGPLLIDTTGGVSAELPTATVQLHGPVTLRRGEIGGSGSVESHGLLQATGAGSRTISADLTNHGTVRVAAGASLVVDVGSAPVTNTGQVHVEAGATMSLAVTGGATAALVQTAGELLVEGTLDAGADALDMQAGTLAGDGAVTGSLVIGGDLLADPRPSPVCFLVEGSWMQTGGEVLLEFDGTNPDTEGCGGGVASGVGTVHDVIRVTGPATLGGKLTVALAGPLDAPLDSFFDVFVAGSISGTFADVAMPVLAGARTFDVTYRPDAVRLVVIAHPCPGDLDDDGAVEVGDLLAVLADWGDNPGLPADIDGNTAVDVTDLLAVLAAWGGCP